MASIKTQSDERALTPNELADRLSVSVHTVLAWIDSGELQALNTARKPTGRPRWKITPQALAVFEAKRTATPVPRAPARRRRKVTDYIDYFGQKKGA